jgi:hypothetical protein
MRREPKIKVMLVKLLVISLFISGLDLRKRMDVKNTNLLLETSRMLFLMFVVTPLSLVYKS